MSRQSARAWQRMLSGRRLDILDPSPVDVELSDIAHGLARVARKYGWRVSASEIRYSESKKADVCRAIGFDNRVREICGPHQPFGGGSRFNR